MFNLTFKRSNGANIAQVRERALNRDAALELIRDRLGMGWILVRMETV